LRARADFPVLLLLVELVAWVVVGGMFGVRARFFLAICPLFWRIAPGVCPPAHYTMPSMLTKKQDTYSM
jgi:hypothetical protein